MSLGISLELNCEVKEGDCDRTVQVYTRST